MFLLHVNITSFVEVMITIFLAFWLYYLLRPTTYQGPLVENGLCNSSNAFFFCFWHIHRLQTPCISSMSQHILWKQISPCMGSLTTEGCTDPSLGARQDRSKKRVPWNACQRWPPDSALCTLHSRSKVNYNIS